MPHPLATLKTVLVGRPKATSGLEHERLPKTLGLAVFSSDALSSSAYATEEMLLVLVAGGTAALTASVPLSIAITAVLAIVILSYRQTVHAYPDGASAYIVASDNLGKVPALVAASALLIDYVLTVAVSISAGLAAVVAAVPGLHGSRVWIALGAIALITVLNLRGLRESGVIFAVPTYAYIALIGGTVIWGLVRVVVFGAGSAPTGAATGGSLSVLLVLRAFSHGSTALTGVEAISDGVQAFREPVARNAARTLLWMGIILGVLFVGLTVLARLFGIEGPTEHPHRTVVSLIALAVFGEGPMFLAVQAATALILFLAANTSYADFPRLSAFLARDRYAPRQLMNRGDRLAFSNGILALGVAAGLLVFAYGADVSRLINLYVVGVFTSFTLSQAGMVVHWRRRRGVDRAWRRNAGINALGASTTFVVLCIVLATKFTHGAWIVVCAIPLLVAVLESINRHYRAVAASLRDPDRVPPPPGENRVVLLVGMPSVEERLAFLYADLIHTQDFRCVHFTMPGDPKGLEARWVRELGLLPTSPALELHPAPDGLRHATVAFVQRMQERARPGDFTTVLVTERVRGRRFGARRALAIKTALLFTRDVVVADVPTVGADDPAALIEHRSVRHVVVVLVSAVHNATLHALNYAHTLAADELHAVHVVLDPVAAERHRAEWAAHGLDVELEMLESPYRRLSGRVRDYVRTFTEDERTVVTVVIPEFVVRKWWHHLLHNQNAVDLKWMFLREPDVVVTSVPYHLTLVERPGTAATAPGLPSAP